MSGDELDAKWLVRRWRERLFLVLVGGFAVAMFFSAVGIFVVDEVYRCHYSHRTFDRDTWDGRLQPVDRESWNAPRHAVQRSHMARDLLDNHLHNGMTAREVIDLLGSDHMCQWDSPPFDERGGLRAGRLEYSIGDTRGPYRWDSVFLALDFDDAGRLTRAWVYGY